MKTHYKTKYMKEMKTITKTQNKEMYKKQTKTKTHYKAKYMQQTKRKTKTNNNVIF